MFWLYIVGVIILVAGAVLNAYLEHPRALGGPGLARRARDNRTTRRDRSRARAPHMMSALVRRLLASGRFFIIVAVIGSLVASATALVYGGITTLLIVLRTVRQGEFTDDGAKLLSVGAGHDDRPVPARHRAVHFCCRPVRAVFINQGLPMPPWLRITTLDDLKERLLGVVAVLLAVTFLGSAVTWKGGMDILYLGIAIGVRRAGRGVNDDRHHGAHTLQSAATRLAAFERKRGVVQVLEVGARRR